MSRNKSIQVIFLKVSFFLFSFNKIVISQMRLEIHFIITFFYVRCFSKNISKKNDAYLCNSNGYINIFFLKRIYCFIIYSTRQSLGNIRNQLKKRYLSRRFKILFLIKHQKLKYAFPPTKTTIMLSFYEESSPQKKMSKFKTYHYPHSFFQKDIKIHHIKKTKM